MAVYSQIGKSLHKKDAGDKATGQTKYGADFLLPGLLVARLLRSPYPHARIVEIDPDPALRLPGVRAVVTAQDMPRVRLGRWIHDRPVLARDKVRHVGEPVAAVAAVDAETAEEALELIRVTYEELPAVFSPIEAMAEGAAIIHEDLTSYAATPPHRPCGNVLTSGRLVLGDVESAWAECDLIYEDRYETKTVHHGFVQLHEVTGAIDSQGRITLWSSTKAPFPMRDAVAEGLGIPMSRLRVIAAGVGGDFGGKGTASLEPICALLTMKAGKPVRLCLTREEEFTSTFIRTAAVAELKMGARSDGTLVAFQGNITYDTGAYCDSVGFLEHGALDLFGPYRIPNIDNAASLVYTNNPPRGHMRAPRHPQANFAIESHIESMAHKLGLDPVQMRLINALHDGDMLPEGQRLKNSGLKKALHVVSGYIDQEKTAGAAQGWGVACGQFGMRTGNIPAASSAEVRLNQDGTVVLVTGVTDSGCGPVTILAQIVAEVLCVPYDAVSVVAADTDTTPYELGTGGSATTHRVGTIVRLAAEHARRQLLALAAEKLKLEMDDLTIGQGKVYSCSVPDKSLSIGSLAKLAMTSIGPIVGQSTALLQPWLAAAKEHMGTVDGPEYCVHAAQVEVDKETGEVHVLKYLAAHDAGFALNPANVEGQIQGSVACGLGFALSEEVLLDHGRACNANLHDYRVPNATAMPHVDIAVLEVPSDYGPYGAKGIGEVGTVPVAAAIANAIYDVTGVRITSLPLTPENVLRHLKESGTA